MNHIKLEVEIASPVDREYHATFYGRDAKEVQNLIEYATYNGESEELLEVFNLSNDLADRIAEGSSDTEYFINNKSVGYGEGDFDFTIPSTRMYKPKAVKVTLKVSDTEFRTAVVCIEGKDFNSIEDKVKNKASSLHKDIKKILKLKKSEDINTVSVLSAVDNSFKITKCDPEPKKK